MPEVSHQASTLARKRWVEVPDNRRVGEMIECWASDFLGEEVREAYRNGLKKMNELALFELDEALSDYLKRDSKSMVQAIQANPDLRGTSKRAVLHAFRSFSAFLEVHGGVVATTPNLADRGKFWNFHSRVARQPAINRLRWRIFLTLQGESTGRDATLARLLTLRLKHGRHPTQIGSYQVVKVLGEGGMGTVYLCDQVRTVQRKVAVKVLRLGRPDVVRRFLGERQLLASMNHPCIANIYDGGITEGGRPFFVMEYVQGRPLGEYCAQERLDLGQRLRLFQQICEGLNHAHQKGVIHRDIKPANILVTERNGKPVPKIIDFGVAKVLQPGSGCSGQITQFGQLLGTPSYMSPEQWGFKQLDVDTRSDVYALGMLLYELLTGRLPFGKVSAQVLYLKVLRKPPLRPSEIVARMGNEREQLAAERSSSVRTWVQMLKRDLDYICLKAIMLDRDLRYPSVAAFADDVERVLRHLPTSAHPQTKGYHLKKFIALYRRAVILVSAAVFMLAAVCGFALYKMAQLQDQQRQTGRSVKQEHLSANYQERLLALWASSSPNGMDPVGDWGVQLDRIAAEITADPQLADDRRAGLLQKIGRIDRGRGRFSQAAGAMEKAHSLYLGLYGPEAAESLAAHAELAELRKMMAASPAVGLSTSGKSPLR